MRSGSQWGSKSQFNELVHGFCLSHFCRIQGFLGWSIHVDPRSVRRSIRSPTNRSGAKSSDGRVDRGEFGRAPPSQVVGKCLRRPSLGRRSLAMRSGSTWRQEGYVESPVVRCSMRPSGRRAGPRVGAGAVSVRVILTGGPTSALLLNWMLMSPAFIPAGINKIARAHV